MSRLYVAAASGIFEMLSCTTASTACGTAPPIPLEGGPTLVKAGWMPPIPFWAKPRFVFLAILAYLAAHFAIRLALGPGLSGDDAEQALFSQRYALSYSYRSPSLATWILLTIGYLMPIGVVAISVMRYGLLAITYFCGYLTARRLIADPRLSALAVYSFAAIHIFAESSHRNLTHSTSLAAMLALSWYVFVRLAASPRLGWYLALGVVFGLGLLAKWNFVIFAVALPLACLLHAQSRRLVLTWRTLVAIAVAAAIASPVLVAQLHTTSPPGQGIEAALGVEESPWVTASWTGTWTLLESAVLYLMPLLPIAALLLSFPFWRGLRSRIQRASSGHPAADAVGRCIAIALIVLWLIVLIVGVTELKVRYMHPILLIAPVWLFIVVEAGRPSRRAVGLYALVMAALAVESAGDRILQRFGITDCGLCQEWRPYPALADALRDAGYDGSGTILTDGETGGNLRGHFPDARIVDPRYPIGTWPAPSGEGQCLIISVDGGVPDRLAATMQGYEAYLSQTLGGDPAAPHRDGAVSAPMPKPLAGRMELGYRLYGGPVGDCR